MPTPRTTVIDGFYRRTAPNTKQRLFPGIQEKVQVAFEVTEPVTVMTYTEAGEAKNTGSDVVLEMAKISPEALERNLAIMIAGAVENGKTLTTSHDRIGDILDKYNGPDGQSFIVMGHPNVRREVWDVCGAHSNVSYVLRDEGLPEGPDGTNLIILSAGRLGLVTQNEADGSGAFLFHERLSKVLVTVQGTTVWDRLMRDSLID